MPLVLLLLLLFLVQTPQDLKAQESAATIRAEVGPEISKLQMESALSFAAAHDDGYYLLRSATTGFEVASIPIDNQIHLYLDEYDKTMNFRKTLPLKDTPVTDFGKAKEKAFEFMLSDDQQNIWLFYSDLSGSNNRLFRQRLNQEQFAFEEPILVAELPLLHKELDRRSTYELISSDDGSRHAVHSILPNRGGAEVYVEVFDSSLKSKWRIENHIDRYRSKSLKSKAEKMLDGIEDVRAQYSLSRQGTLNLLLVIVTQEVRILESEQFMLSLFSFAEGLERPGRKDLETGDQKIQELSIGHRHDGRLVLAGYYADKKKSEYVDGLYFETYDASSLETQGNPYKPFSKQDKLDFFLSSEETSCYSPEVREKRMKAKAEKDAKLELYSDADILSQYHHADGSCTLLSEDSDFNSATHVYEHRDLQLVHFSPDGEISWIKNYHKQQAMQEYLLGSISHFQKEDKILFIYNDFSNKRLSYGSVDLQGNLHCGNIFSLTKQGPLQKCYFIRSSLRALHDGSYLAIAHNPRKHMLLNFLVD